MTDIFDKNGLAQGRDLTIESFKEEIPNKSWFVMRYDIKVQEHQSLEPNIIEPPPHDVFLAYLEFKMKQPFLTRIFLPWYVIGVKIITFMINLQHTQVFIVNYGRKRVINTIIWTLGK